MSRLAALVLVALTFLPAVPARGAERSVCDDHRPKRMRCFAVRSGLSPRAAEPLSRGLTPADVKRAYRFPANPAAGRGQTIAIVAAFNSPHAESDLNVFSKRFGLPGCTRANGCFRKVNQRGATNRFPVTDLGWALEISMDVQWAHAIAPGAKILLVEADDNSIRNLMAAVDYASKHARYVSNSWGGDQFEGQLAYDPHFSRKGVSYFFSSGDDGYASEWPTSSAKVISVGGTTLREVGSPGFSEKGWEGSGGGCNRYVKASAAQAAFEDYRKTGCAGRRATPDLSLVADPSTGVSVYDSTPIDGEKGWHVLGGTSASAPMVAARAAITGKVVNASSVYGSKIAFRDITVGNNGAPCRTGWDFVTGRGSWTS
jgi:subtilase family serine protease